MFLRPAALLLVPALALSALPTAADAQQATQPAPLMQPTMKLKQDAGVARPRKVVRKRVKAKPNPRRVAERAGYKKVSSLVNFPSFFPGIGVLYVKPDTLPVGPFLAFDRKDHLVSTTYMIPIEDVQNHKKFDFSRMTAHGNHVTLYFNPGHAGVDMPHYHLVVWHVGQKEEQWVAK